MRTVYAVLLGFLMAVSTSVATAAPEFPGLPEIGTELLGPEMTQEEIQKQKEHRQKLEEFAKKLKEWWYAKNYPKPIPYVTFNGKRIKLPKNFLQAYLKAHKQGKLKETWPKIEKSFKKGNMFKKA